MYLQTALQSHLRKILASLFIVLCTACVQNTPLPPTTDLSTLTASPTNFIFPPTFTPTEPGPATVTLTPGPSRTPAPTSTLGATLAPSPTPLVDILLASAENGPFLNASLLYFNGGSIRLWDSLNGEIKSVAPEDSGSIQFDLVRFSSGGSRIAAGYQVDAAYAIVIFDRFSGAVARVIPVDAPGLEDMALSPDGAWLAFIPALKPTQEASPTPDATGTATPETTEEATPSPSPTVTSMPTQAPDNQATSGIYVVSTAGENEPEAFAACETTCRGLLWSPTSTFLAWGRQDGLWEVNLTDPGEEIQLLEPFLSGVSASSQTTDSYFPLQISPSGRFILVRNGLSTGSVLAVYDRLTGLVENAPGTGAYTGAGTGVTWLSGDRLFIARPGLVGPDILPGGEIWGVTPASQDGFFQLLLSFSFPGDINTRPEAPTELADSRIGFSLINLKDSNDSEVNGLYILDPASGLLERLNYLPLLQVEEIIWVPNLSGALVLSQSRLLFVSAGFGQVYSMRLLLGTDACCFQWLP